MSRDETQARHRKEIKALDGEKRASLKKAKATAGKGKKAKELLAEVEAEFAAKLKELEEKHNHEIAALTAGSAATATEAEVSEANSNENNLAAATESTSSAAGENKNNKSAQEEERERKQTKARRKREKAREKERERELQIERENAQAGPSMRKIEVEQIEEQLTPLGLKIAEIPSDGNCLYRAISAHLGNRTFQDTRNLCADALLKNEAEFAPFCEYDGDKIPDFASYVGRVRNSSDWGGHLELRALSLALNKQIVVYSAQSKDPLVIKPETSSNNDDADPIRLSYHLHYYALGEHYNQVVKASTS